MDVRCERCRAQYVFDDDQVTPAGLAVRCTNCGHLFRVKKKELVVTVPVRPDEIEGTPLPASAVAHRAAPEHREPVREWRLRQANGSVFTFRELTTLQKWIIERKVGRDDEISVSGGQWKRLGGIGELASFFQVVDAAERGRALSGLPAAPAFGIPAPPPIPPPPSGYPPPSFARPPAPVPPQRDWHPMAQPPPPEAGAAPGPESRDAIDEDAATVDVELGDLGPAKKGRGARIGFLLAAVVLAGGAAAYAFAPRLFRGPPEAAPAPPPAVAEAKPQEPPPPAPAEPPPAPVAAPEPVAERSIEPPPAPVAAPKPAAPQGPKALLARAGRLREKGDFAAALDLYGRVASEDPENAEALTGRGLCYLDLERYAPAEASFQAALQVDPREEDALLGLAETYRWQGKKADAIRYYERYLASYPQGEEAQVAKNALEELRK